MKVVNLIIINALKILCPNCLTIGAEFSIVRPINTTLIFTASSKLVV